MGIIGATNAPVRVRMSPTKNYFIFRKWFHAPYMRFGRFERIAGGGLIQRPSLSAMQGDGLRSHCEASAMNCSKVSLAAGSADAIFIHTVVERYGILLTKLFLPERSWTEMPP